MFSTLDVFKTAMAMARHSGQQQALSARNIANADTPGYRSAYLPEFADHIPPDPAAMRATRPEHMHGPYDRVVPSERTDVIEDPNGNTVSLEREMVDAVNAKRQHDRAMAIYRNGMSILRASLGN